MANDESLLAEERLLESSFLLYKTMMALFTRNSCYLCYIISSLMYPPIIQHMGNSFTLKSNYPIRRHQQIVNWTQGKENPQLALG